MARNQTSIPISVSVKKSAELFVGEGKPYNYISNLVDDAVRRRVEELMRLTK